MKIKNIFKRRKQNIGFVLNKHGSYDFVPKSYINLNEAIEVKTCVDKIADLVSNMTIHLMENTEDGDVRIVNELSKKVDISPCKLMTKKAWLYNIVYNLLMNGNAYVYPEINELGYIENLIPLDAKYVSFHWIEDIGDYYISYEGKNYNSDEIVHFVLNPSESNPFVGTGYRVNLKDISEALQMATQTRKSFMRGKYMPNIIVKVDADTEELTSEEGRIAIENKYLTRAESGKPWVVPADLLEIQQIKPLSLRDIALNEAVELDKKTVASIFGLPSFMLGVGEYDKSEFNMFISNRIMSIAKIIEQTLTKSLIINSKWYFKCNPRSLYSYDISEIASIGMDMFSRGLMLGNEVRDWLGMPPHPELNELIILENFIKAKDIEKQGKLVDKGGD